jgi:hypothetical protein
MVSLRFFCFPALRSAGILRLVETMFNCVLLVSLFESRINRPAVKFEVETGQYMPPLGAMRIAPGLRKKEMAALCPKRANLLWLEGYWLHSGLPHREALFLDTRPRIVYF